MEKKCNQDKKEREAELLAPAGSFETMLAAYQAGADAVYIGGASFGARAYADNLDESKLLKAIRYAHIHQKKLYLTVNTLLKEQELEEQLYTYLYPYYIEGLDAVIVQDLGVMRAVKTYFPDLPIHCSTQMAITGPCAAAQLEKMGATRVVLPREMSIAEIKEIAAATAIELEGFVHGALCYSYSGRCLFSSIAGGRSGNRGRCAQPCRMAYSLERNNKVLIPEKNGYLLSPKDLNTITKLPEIIEAGVYSLKIEGRMKKPEYTAGVVQIYRKYLDWYLEHGKNGYSVTREDEAKLFDLFNRKGFTTGYYFKQNGDDMLTRTKPQLRLENEALNQQIRESCMNRKLKENIKGKVKIFSEKPAMIELCCGETRISFSSDIVSKAQNRPIIEADIRKAMDKIKDTDFQWDVLEIETDGKSFYPIGKLNELRRAGLEELEKALCKSSKRTIPLQEEMSQNVNEMLLENNSTSMDQIGKKIENQFEKPMWYAEALTKEQVEVLLKEEWIKRIYIDCHAVKKEEWKAFVNKVKQAKKECFLSLPKLVRKKGTAFMESQRSAWIEAGFDGYLVSCAEGALYAKSRLNAADIIGDHSLYSYSKLAEQEWKQWGLSSMTAPVELNRSELKKRTLHGMEMIVYGRLPMMITAQCMHQSLPGGCSGVSETLHLRDRMGNLFYVRNFCQQCYNIIYNCLPISLDDSYDAICACDPKALRLIFTTEDSKQMQAVLDLYRNISRGIFEKVHLKDTTRGHWKRGVE